MCGDFPELEAAQAVHFQRDADARRQFVERLEEVAKLFARRGGGFGRGNGFGNPRGKVVGTGHLVPSFERQMTLQVERKIADDAVEIGDRLLQPSGR